MYYFNTKNSNKKAEDLFLGTSVRTKIFEDHRNLYEDMVTIPRDPWSRTNNLNQFNSCSATYSDQTKALQCMVDSLEKANNVTRTGMDVFFLLYAGTLVFLMQAGFAMLCAGSVRLKNVQNTMLKNLLDACGAALGFFSVGYAFAYGGSEYGDAATFIGSKNFFLSGDTNFVFWLFQFAFAATSATIVAGTLAERCQMTAYLLYSIMLTGFVYPVIVHAVWSYSGFLSAAAKDPLWGSGVVDFAGSGVVHLTGGITALFATYMLGARKGRFHDAHGRKIKNPKPIPGNSAALQVLGLFILWFGWYGFNAGSAFFISSKSKATVTSLAAVNTTLSAAAGAVTSLFVNLVITERYTGEAIFDLVKCVNGCLAGLVAITGGCAVLEPWAAVVTGIISAVLYLSTSSLLVRFCLDDAVDAIPVHFSNGIWGLISVGLFASPNRMDIAYGQSKHVGWFYSFSRGSADATLLMCQICSILFIIGWVFVIMFPFFCFLNYKGWFRADALTEIVGLDLSYHGGSYSLIATGRDEISPEHLQAYNERKARNSAAMGLRLNGSSHSAGNEKVVVSDLESSDQDCVDIVTN